MLRAAATLAVAFAALPAGAVSFALQAEVSTEAGAWMRVLPAGTFSARDGRGPFDAGGLVEMRAIVKRSLKLAGSTQLMVDYDHDQGRAAGWIVALEARADGIWAQVQWTEAALTALAAREYRYLSPFFLAPKGRVEVILNVALVNMPALDLEAVAAGLQLPTDKDTMDKIIVALGLKAGASEDAVLAAIDTLKAKPAAFATALGVAVDADAAAIEAAAVKLRQAQPDPAKFVPLSDFTAVRDQLAALKADIEGKTATDAVEAAMQAGKIAPAQKEWALAYAAKDAAGFAAYVAAAPAIAKGQTVPAKTAAEPVLTDEDRIVMRQMGLTEAQMLASRKEMN